MVGGAVVAGAGNCMVGGAGRCVVGGAGRCVMGGAGRCVVGGAGRERTCTPVELAGCLQGGMEYRVAPTESSSFVPRLS